MPKAQWGFEHTETSEFGTDEGLLQGQARRADGSRSKDPNSWVALQAKIGGSGGGVVVTFLWLVDGELTG